MYEHKFKNLNQTPTVKQLQECWKDWCKFGMYKDQRFGQWVYNEYTYEIQGSYEERDPHKAYQMLFHSLTESVGEI